MGVEIISFNPRDIRWKERAKTIRRLYGGEVAIQGAYGGSNIGDLILGEVIKSRIEKEGYGAKLFGHPHTNFSRWDYLVIGGGGILYQDEENNLEYRMKAAESADNFSVHGVGTPILTEESKEHLEVLEKADKISVRDKFSKQKLGQFIEAEIDITADPIFVLANEFRREEDVETIGVNFRPIAPGCIDSFEGYREVEEYQSSFNEIQEQYKEYCGRLWEELLQEYEDVVFLAFSPKDADFAAGLGIEQNRIKSPMKPRKELQYIHTNIDKMVATRYHSLIFAIITGKETKILSYAPKVSALAERLNLPYQEILDLKANIDLEFSSANEKQIENLKSEAEDDFKNLIDYMHRK